MTEEGNIEFALPEALGAQGLEPRDPRRIGAFPIIAVLGSGGMGRVYLGVAPKGYTAVKRVLPGLAGDPGFLRHFGQELDNQARLPAGVSARLLAADRTAHPPWFATEYIPGVTLHDAVHLCDGALPAELVWVLLRELAARLRMVAALDIVHRDLKPSNVMLTAQGVTLIDFGIARAVDQSSVTTTGAIVGTPSFMAPEQAQAVKHLTPAADVFSLGAMLSFAATGTAPFGEGSGADLFYRIVHREPDLDAVAELDAELAEVIASCLAKDPGERPSAADLFETAAAHAAPGAPQWPRTVARLIAARREFAAAPTVRPPAHSDDADADADADETRFETHASARPGSGRKSAAPGPASTPDAAAETETAAAAAADEAAATEAVPGERSGKASGRPRSRRPLVVVVPIVLGLAGTIGTLIVVHLLPFVTNNASGNTRGGIVVGQATATRTSGAGSTATASPGRTRGSATGSAAAASRSATATSASAKTAGQGAGAGGSATGGGGSNGGGGAATTPAATPPSAKTSSAPSDPTVISSSPGLLENYGTHTCLQDEGDGTSMVACSTGSGAQQWYAEYVSGSGFLIINKATGNCLDDLPWTTGGACSSSGPNTWTQGSATVHGSTLEGATNSECMAASGGQVQPATCDGSDAAQQWYRP